MSIVESTKGFLKETQAEFAKVSWPNRKELQANTVVVLLAVVILSVFVGIVDRILTAGLGLLFR
jgi:preprotein translocase subunit SecE